MIEIVLFARVDGIAESVFRVYPVDEYIIPLFWVKVNPNQCVRYPDEVSLFEVIHDVLFEQFLLNWVLLIKKTHKW